MASVQDMPYSDRLPAKPVSVLTPAVPPVPSHENAEDALYVLLQITPEAELRIDSLFEIKVREATEAQAK